jgi:hypothetical protein
MWISSSFLRVFFGFGLLFSILDRKSFTAHFGFSHFFVFFGVKMWKE